MNPVSLFSAADRFLAWAEVNLAPRTVAGYRHYLNRFKAWAGDIDLRELSPAKLTTFSRKCHPVQSVQRLVSWCHREERSLIVNPLVGMKKIQVGKRRRVLMPTEAARMLRLTTDVFRKFMIAMRETIARPQEIRAVCWGDIRTSGNRDWTAGDLRTGTAFFMLPEGKGFNRRVDTTAVRIIPISPRLGRCLLRLWGDGCEANDVIFRDSKGRPWTANAVRCRNRRLRDLAGLVADRRGERVVAYTWRHTGATAAVVAGVRDLLLAEVMGHSSTRTTARYVHLQPDDVIRAMGIIWEAKSTHRRKNDRPESPRNRPDGLQ